MLNELQQKSVWDSWLSAEIRAAYFAELARRYQQFQKALTASTLILTSGATVALLSSVPQGWAWLRLAFAALAAIVSAVSLVAKNERSSIDCADLHSRWANLAVDYEALWSDVYAENAPEQLSALKRREIEISKSSTSMPEDESLLVKCQDNVVMHHQLA